MKKSKLSPLKKTLLGLIALALLVALYFTAYQRPAPKPTSARAEASPVAMSTNDNDRKNSSKNVATLDMANTTKTGIKKATFPLYLDNVPSILHPITPVESNAKASSMISKSSYERGEDSNANYFHEASPYQFSGSIYNLVFENISTGATQRLFPNDNFVIGSIVAPFVDSPLTTALQNLKSDPAKTENTTQAAAEKPVEDTDKKTSAIDKKLMGYFIYQVQEQPISDEDKSNLDSQQSLYMSDFNGKNLVKLHPDTEYVKTVAWLPELERYYFITQNDSNNDKNITIDDSYHNYVIDFKKARETQTLPKAVAYNLLK